METFIAILLTIVSASTPLLLAAMGELVVERSGVLNLGIEGMMIIGAACGFAGAIMSGSVLIGFLTGIVGGAILSYFFAVLVLNFATNQVATGLALTLAGLGISGLIGKPFAGITIQREPIEFLSFVNDIPVVGPILNGIDAVAWFGFALLLAVAWFLNRTRAGLILRAVGDNPVSAHTLGYNVLRVRLYAILFGGACAGLAGAYLSIYYTPFWAREMTAGRGWIALALVVFASWLPYRLLIGAYLFGAVTILQFHAQGAQINIPQQFMASLPYLATIVVLIVISARQTGRKIHTPASLGRIFVPDR
ncbi:MAG: ABC transporter permease [Rhizobiales bacterium]|nr:ABC transporter permease [Hyphomicrobiales bacterium]